MKSDNSKTGEKHLDVPERSIMLPGLGDPQNHEFWGVFIVKKKSKKKIIPKLEIFFWGA